MVRKIYEANETELRVFKDALNNSVKVGDKVAFVTYKGSVSGATNIKINEGTVLKITDSFVAIEDKATGATVRKSSRYVVKI